MENDSDLQDSVDIEDDEIDRVIDINDNDVPEDAMTEEMVDEEEEKDDVEMFEPVVDSSKLTFDKHEDIVYCIDLDPTTAKLAVTGGKDDRAFLWDTQTGNTLLECKGHKDSVSSVGFSYDGTYIATADLGGGLKVWKISSLEEVWSFECDDIEWIKWHKQANVLLAGTVTGQMWMWKIPSGDCKTYVGPNCASTCACLAPDGKRICIGYENGNLRVVGLKEQSTLQEMNFHSTSVTCLDFNQDNSLLLSGSSDLKFYISNSNSGKVVNVFDLSTDEEDEDADNSIESVAFSKTQPWAAIGTLKGSVYLWDIQAGKIRNSWNFHESVIKLKWMDNGKHLFTVGLDGVVRLWDTRDGQLIHQWHGHAASIMDFDISKNGSLIATVADDRTAKIFSFDSPSVILSEN